MSQLVRQFETVPIPDNGTLKEISLAGDLSLSYQQLELYHYSGWSILAAKSLAVTDPLPVLVMAAPGLSRSIVSLLPSSEDGKYVRSADGGHLPFFVRTREEIGSRKVIESFERRIDLYNRLTRPSLRVTQHIPRLRLADIEIGCEVDPQLQMVYDVFFGDHWLLNHPTEDVSVVVRQRLFQGSTLSCQSNCVIESPPYDIRLAPFRAATVADWYRNVVLATVAQKFYGQDDTYLDVLYLPSSKEHLRPSLCSALCSYVEEPFEHDWNLQRIRITPAWTSLDDHPKAQAEQVVGMNMLADMLRDEFMVPSVELPEAVMEAFMSWVGSDEAHENEEES